ncbi:MAG TPA: formate dehydrogenase accessory sulfurtransferase FdhD, partial [Labilithrix sp.]
AADGRAIAGAVLADAVRAIRDHQPVFAATGGTHAASLVRFDGTHVATFEDVGRHNAVDKLVGSQVRSGAVPLAAHALVVSGRSSFEIVQKAVTAGIPIVASVSAASSLAVDLAKRAGATLVGFAREGAFTIYCGESRLR